MKFRSIVSTVLSLALVFSISACSKSASSRGGANGTDGMSENDLGKAYEDRFGSASIPSAEGEGMFRDVHFDYDSSQISDEARQNVDFNVELLKQNPNMKIVLEGHCDERGTAEYNMALGNERAQAVAKVLQSYGIASDRVRTISYGEEVPLDPGHDELAFSKNRRVHFSIVAG